MSIASGVARHPAHAGLSRGRLLTEIKDIQARLIAVAQLLDSPAPSLGPAPAATPAPRRGPFRQTRASRRPTAPRPSSPARAEFPTPCHHCEPYCGMHCECSCHRVSVSAVLR